MSDEYAGEHQCELECELNDVRTVLKCWRVRKRARSTWTGTGNWAAAYRLGNVIVGARAAVEPVTAVPTSV